MKRAVAVLVATVLAVSLASVAGSQGATASPGLRAGAASTSSLSTWVACGPDQCATLTVPLDYANPDGATIGLAVRRRVHTSSTYQGVMLVNPGGPGASGTGLVALADYVPGGVGHEYDWIGWDPRGVGRSTPSLHCNSRYFGVDRPSFVPRTHRLMHFWRTKARRYAAACGASAAKALLPHMTTLDNVKDMESLRIALGVATISFYGFSYGTYLGQVYATTYPDKVGRFVLDGVVDPTRYWYGSNLDQERGFDRNLNVFFRWVARHPGAYHLGRRWRVIRRGYNAELRKLDRQPAYHGRLGPDELTDGVLGAAYYVFGWDATASAYARLVLHGRGAAMFSLYAASSMGDDNNYAVYLGTQCTDAGHPSWSRQVADAWRIFRHRPFLAWDNTWYNAPCLSWPAASRAPIAVSGASVTSKMLLVNETRDAATPYAGAVRVRDLFPTASLIAGVGGTTHAGSLNGVACVDDRIAAFLDTGTTPARLATRGADVNCPRVMPTQPSSSGRAYRYAGMSPALRAQLLGAQRPSLG